MRSQKITTEMKAALKATLAGDVGCVKKTTLNALVRRELMESSSELTVEGWKHAVASVKLPEQCRHLEIPLEQIAGLDFGSEPERTAWLHYQRQGYQGAYCEGGAVLLLIHAAALDLLEKLNPFGSREDACNRFTEAQLTIHEDHISAIATSVEEADLRTVERGFREIYRSLLVQETYPGLTESAIGAVFSALGGKRLRKIAEADRSSISI